MSGTTRAAVARVRATCLTFPNAVVNEGVANGVGRFDGTGVTSFSVSRRIFARLFVLAAPDGGDTVVLWIRAEPDERQSLIASGHPYLPAGAREVAVVLDSDTDWTEIQELVSGSYVMMAPKKLAAEVVAGVRRAEPRPRPGSR